MKLSGWFISLLIYPVFTTSNFARREYDSHAYYVLEFDPTAAEGQSFNQVLQTFGVELVERLGPIENHWLVRRRKLPEEIEKRTVEERDPVVAQYREAISREEGRLGPRNGRVSNPVKSLSLQVPRQRVKRAPPPIPPPKKGSSLFFAQKFGIDDPLFPEQWHLVNDEFPEHMMNVTGVWDMGYKGKGVISSLIDDGLDYESQDLAENFDAENSHDYNDHVSLPTPKLFDDTHGTRCAGQIAAVKNGVCGVGIAYESRVAGVRILSGPITDADEALALNFGYQNVSIYSCSWGPPDDGAHMEGPNQLVTKAMLEGINNGRGGKGSVFVFASGNGHSNGDQCNFDGYTNSIWSVTVASVDYKGQHPYYSEACAATMVTAYSSGSGKSIVTTDKGKDKCTKYHGGTSAAAPNAVGVLALALQARPTLTWRDVQHLCVETSRHEFLYGAEWETTAIGRRYSYKFGYGALDGYAFVKAALDWKLVKPQTWLQTSTVQLADGKMDENKTYSGGEPITVAGVTSTITITEDDLLRHNLEKLEHLNVKVWIQHEVRGEVEVEIVSPNGIKSMLAGPRQGDRDKTGYPGWTFMSVKHWGEDPVGPWTIRVWDAGNEHKGSFIGWNMILWGESIDASKATTKFELPPENLVFPPHDDPPPPLPSVSVTRMYTKPTAFLNEPSGAHPPTIPGNETTQRGKLVVGIIVAAVLLAVIGTFVLWRREKNKEGYSSVEDDDMPMGAAVGRSRYDDADTAREERADEPLLSSRRDEDGHYEDEPDTEPQPAHRQQEQSGSPGGSSSGDGSWVHTAAT